VPDRSPPILSHGILNCLLNLLGFIVLTRILLTLRALIGILSRPSSGRIIVWNPRAPRPSAHGWSLPLLQVGNATAISRVALIERFVNTAKGDRFQWELSRRARVSESLEAVRKHSAAQRIQIAAPLDSRNRVIGDHIPGIELGPGELTVHFHGAEDLASKLFELSQAMANDWSEIKKLVGE